MRLDRMDQFVRAQRSFRIACVGKEAGKSTGAQCSILAHRQACESLSAAEACWGGTRTVLAAILDLANIPTEESMSWGQLQP